MKQYVRLSFTFGLTALFVTAVAGQTWRSTPSDADAMLRFGSNVAIAGEHVLVAEASNDYSSGFVYVYGRGEQGLTQLARLAAPDSEWGDAFGSSLDVSDNTLVVGATRKNEGQGAAYVFERTNGIWEATARVTANQPTKDFGRSVSVDGGWLIVGSSGDEEQAGTAYIFRRANDGSWAQSAALKAEAAAPMTGYASKVAFASGLALVAAPHTEEGGVIYTFGYDEQSASWMEKDPISAGDVGGKDEFGSNIAASGTEMLIAALGAEGRRGTVYLYKFDQQAGRWNEARTLVPFDAPRNAYFGAGLAFNGHEIWVGSPMAEGFKGTAYVYDRAADGVWTGVRKVSADDVERGDFFGWSLAANGDLAVVGLSGADFGAGKAAIFERQNGEWIVQTSLVAETVGLNAITGGRITCEDGKANIFGCSKVDMLSFLPVQDMGGSRGVRVNDMWGWEDPDTGREYALVGRVDGTSFVDVTDPYHPIYLGNLSRTEGSQANVWRDIKVYKNHAFIVADGAGEHGIQIFDLTQLRNVQSPPVDFNETAHYDKIHSAHNIVINEETGFAFSVGNSAGGETCGGGLHMIDVSNPVRPLFAGCFADPNTGRRNTGYSHDAQCVVYHGPDTDYTGREICFGSNETAISIADVTDKKAPVAVSSATYPNVAYTHQGWLTEDHRYFLMNDEGDEPSGMVDGTRTLIWDVQDLDDPQLLVEYIADNPAIDHNLYIKGNLVFESNYASGLRILDISDIENPVEVGFFDTVPFGPDDKGMSGSWSNYPFFKNGVIGVTSGYEGLFLLKRQDEGI